MNKYLIINVQHHIILQVTYIHDIVSSLHMCSLCSTVLFVDIWASIPIIYYHWHINHTYTYLTISNMKCTMLRTFLNLTLYHSKGSVRWELQQNFDPWSTVCGKVWDTKASQFDRRITKFDCHIAKFNRPFENFHYWQAAKLIQDA